MGVLLEGAHALSRKQHMRLIFICRSETSRALLALRPVQVVSPPLVGVFVGWRSGCWLIRIYTQSSFTIFTSGVLSGICRCETAAGGHVPGVGGRAVYLNIMYL